MHKLFPDQASIPDVRFKTFAVTGWEIPTIVGGR